MIVQSQITLVTIISSSVTLTVRAQYVDVQHDLSRHIPSCLTGVCRANAALGGSNLTTLQFSLAKAVHLFMDVKKHVGAVRDKDSTIDLYALDNGNRQNP